MRETGKRTERMKTVFWEIILNFMVRFGIINNYICKTKQ